MKAEHPNKVKPNGINLKCKQSEREHDTAATLPTHTLRRMETGVPPSIYKLRLCQHTHTLKHTHTETPAQTHDSFCLTHTEPTATDVDGSVGGVGSLQSVTAQEDHSS